jgi:asparagine synthase (glutamine-hydrolysing)
MCGIYGFVGERQGPLGAARPLLDRMGALLIHRGPDDQGEYIDGRCAMGMRRLSILDLSHGHQPISDENGRYWVVYNGEIYNYRALRHDLEARGHQFKTGSDAEILVHLYEERGEDLVEALNGMFAFALWDRLEHSLLLARDRLGIKPLYYALVPSGLVFASELKALLAHPQIERRASPIALSHYLSFGTTPGHQAILEGVEKLEPGRLLRFHRGLTDLRRYWQPPTGERQIGLDEAAAEIRILVTEAVQSQLQSDVPVGAFLSGGIDSAVVVAIMASFATRPKTFCIGFEEEAFDERARAHLIAKHFDTDHYELVVKPDAWTLCETLAYTLDEPFADVSAVPTYLVSELASRHVRVVLTGDGGDELFAGYDRYPQALRERRFNHFSERGRNVLHAFSGLLPERWPGKYLLRHYSLPTRLRYIDGQSLFTSDLKARLIGPALLDSMIEHRYDPSEIRATILESAPGDALRQFTQFDLLTYLPYDVLTKVDRATMAHSIEARPPLLDHRLVEAALTLPSHLKIAGSVQKRVLKRAFANLLPETILSATKRGFGVPVAAWFRGPLRNQISSILFESRTRERGYLNLKLVRCLMDEHLAGRRDQSLRLWALTMLELWCRRYLDEPVSVQLETAHA